MQTGRITPPNRLCDRRAAERGRQTQLIASCHEDAICFLDVIEILV